MNRRQRDYVTQLLSNLTHENQSLQIDLDQDPKHWTRIENIIGVMITDAEKMLKHLHQAKENAIRINERKKSK